MKDELVAFVHCSNPLAQQEEISLDLLKQTPIVLRELGSGTLDVIRKSPTGKRHCSLESEYRDESWNHRGYQTFRRTLPMYGYHQRQSHLQEYLRTGIQGSGSGEPEDGTGISVC